MDIKTEIMINGEVVSQDGDLTSNGLHVYHGNETDSVYICKGDKVVYVLSVDAFRGEGGGGSINIEKAQ